MSFNTISWHDSKLLDIQINRENPGLSDEVQLTISWADDTKQLLIFTDCYAVNLQMNFGVIAAETILDASMMQESDQLIEIQRRWENYKDIDLSNLKLFQIETNSTHSTIQIFAMDYHLKALD